MNKNTQYNLKSSQKLKVLLILVFSFLFCQNLSSQFFWQKTYNSYIGGDDEGYDGCAADGSNFYVVGYTGILDYYMYVLKLNQLGDTLWTRTYIGGIANAVTPSGDGGCVFTGQRNSCFSMKLDLNGNVVWDKSYPTGAETRDIIRTADSGYVMCGGFFSGYICKLDTLGNLVWERYYNDAPQDFDNIKPINGDYVVCGRKRINNVWKGFLMKIDHVGNIIWQTYFDYKFASSFVITNNGFLVCSGYEDVTGSKIVLIKTDQNGIKYFADTVITGGTLNGGQEILEMNNKYYLSLYTSITNHYGYVGKVLQLDTSFNIIKNITLIADTNSLHLFNILPAPMSGINDIIVLGAAEPRGLYEVDLYVARLDSALTQPPPLKIENISNIIPFNSELSQNYPNPFNPVTNIKFEIPKDVNVSIKIYDILGSEVFSLNEYKRAGSYEVQFDGTNFASGIYFYKLETDRFSDTKKMVLLK